MSHEITLKNISAVYMEATIETKCPRASVCSENLILSSALWKFGKKSPEFKQVPSYVQQKHKSQRKAIEV